MDPNLNLAGASTIPSELTGQVPRKTCLSRKGIGMAIRITILLALAVAVAIWVGMDTVQQMQHRAALRLGGSEAVATITWMGSSGRSATITVKYRFTVNGEIFTGKAVVPHQLYPSLLMSDSLPIRYLPADRTVNHPAAWEWSAFLVWDSFFALLMLVATAMMLLLWLRIERRLVVEGVPAVGVITKCSPSTRGGFFVKYEFHAEDGRVIKGNGWSESSQEGGASICILYLPQNLWRNKPYPSANYRVAQ